VAEGLFVGIGTGDTLAIGQGEPVTAGKHQPETDRRITKVLLNRSGHR